MDNWFGRRPRPLSRGQARSWLRAGFETGMFSDGPYPVRQTFDNGEWTWRSALLGSLFLGATALMGTWAIWGGR